MYYTCIKCGGLLDFCDEICCDNFKKIEYYKCISCGKRYYKGEINEKI